MPPRRPPIVVLSVFLTVVLALTSCGQTGVPGGSSSTASTLPTSSADLQAAVERNLSSGSVALTNVRAVLVSVDGQPRLTDYREGATDQTYSHVWSVTKSVTSTLVGIALDEHLIGSLDQTLGELLPEHKAAMSAAEQKVTLRQVMTMTGGFSDSAPDTAEIAKIFRTKDNLVDALLRDNRELPSAGQFDYSNYSAHLVAAVLDHALRTMPGDHPKTLFGYAKARLFDPLGIDTTNAWTKPLADDRGKDFLSAGFGWGTDPQGIPIGAFGLRLTAPDLLKFGQLYLDGGRWDGKQLVPAGWVEQVAQPAADRPSYGLLWWVFVWDGHRVLVARGTDGHLLVISPDQHAVIAITSSNTADYQIDEEALFPLANQVILPALG